MSKVQEHRYKRVNKDVHFYRIWDYVKTLKIKREDFEKAIDIAPSIKPNRHTFIHEEEYGEKRQKNYVEIEILNSIFE